MIRGSVQVDRPARRARVRPPAATVDGGGAPQQPRRRAAARPARGGVRDPPRHLRDQGEPHLRPGLRRPGQGQRRPVARPVQGRLGAEPARARPPVHAARQLLRRRGGVAGRPPMVDPGDGHRLRRQDLAVRLRLGLLPKLRQRVRAAGPAVRVGAAGRRPDGAADGGGRDRRLPVGRRLRPRRQLPRLRRGHAVGRPAQLPQRHRLLRPHPPPGPLRRARRPALPRLEPRLLRPRGARARVGARVPRLRARTATCPASRSCTCPTTTPRGRRRARRRRRPTRPTTTSPSAGWSTPSRTAATGGAPRSSSSRTTPRTAPTTSTPTAPPALVISPFTQHAGVDSTHYDTAGMLGTIEDILGLDADEHLRPARDADVAVVRELAEHAPVRRPADHGDPVRRSRLPAERHAARRSPRPRPRRTTRSPTGPTSMC